MRGYFAMGAEGISKSRNLGNLMRSAHAFGASWAFTVDAAHEEKQLRQADTSGSAGSIPLYAFDNLEQMILPKGCALVGIELTDDAIELPSFRHPRCAAYVLGPERDSLSSAMVERCDLIVKIPTKFCVNVAVAGAIVMYDRVKQLGAFPAPPISPYGKVDAKPEHIHGQPILRREGWKKK
jgi:tRNA G18 (ribose-2'-O)-methylase SpoU